MVLTFDANGGGSFMTGDLATKISRESTSTLSALNLPWFFEKEPDPYFYLSGSMHWSPILSLNATLPTSTLVHAHYLISLPYTQALRVSVAVKAAVRAIQYRSTVIGQSYISISLFIQGECDMRTTCIFDVKFFCLSGSHTSAKFTGSSSTYTASIQLRSFPSYTPPAINFSRIVDQTSIFNWSQGAPYMLNGKKHFLLPQKFQCIISSCFFRLSALLAHRSEGLSSVLFGLHLQF